MVIRSKAPLRISFGGGGTDVSPYPEEQGGATISATIDKYAYCTLIERHDEHIKVKSLDYDITANYQTNCKLQYDGKLDLVKAAINAMEISEGFDLFLHADAPAGSGLGTSSTMTVALVGSIQDWLKRPLTDYEIAELAHHIEREEAGIKGGSSGALYVVISVSEHEFFIRDGDDILHKLQINFAQAALGTEVEVPTLYGETKLKIPAGSQTGKIFRLKKQGITHLRRNGRGDQLVRLVVVTPDALTKQQRQLFEDLAKTLEPADGI